MFSHSSYSGSESTYSTDASSASDSIAAEDSSSAYSPSLDLDESEDHENDLVGATSLFFALSEDRNSMHELLQKHISSNKNKTELNLTLICAVKNNDLEMSEKLLQFNADPNFKKLYSALFHAIQNKNVSMVELLITHHADVNPKMKNDLPGLIHFALLAGVEIVAKLLQAGASINFQQREKKEWNRTWMRDLLKEDNSLSTQSKQGTLLLITTLLLAYGAANLKDKIISAKFMPSFPKNRMMELINNSANWHQLSKRHQNEDLAIRLSQALDWLDNHSEDLCKNSYSLSKADFVMNSIKDKIDNLSEANEYKANRRGCR